MKVLLDVEDVDFLKNRFGKFNPQLLRVQYIGTISVFSLCFDSEKELNENWEIITSSIAAYYQSEFEDDESEFERWNIYILFLVKENVSNQLKYKVENDKFSSRKIVQDRVGDVLQTTISELIMQHIINSDLDISSFDTSNRNPEYLSDSTIYKIIERSDLKISGKGTTKNELEILYEQIIKETENEIQKD